MSNHRKLLFILVPVVVVLLAAAAILAGAAGGKAGPGRKPIGAVASPTPGIEKTATVNDTGLKDKVEQLLKEITGDNPSSSSNPYDYIKDSKAFEELTALGKPAMQCMFDSFAQNNGDGLREYVMACACAKIMGLVDGEKGIGITSGREWFYKYGQFEKEKDLQAVDADEDIYGPITWEKGNEVVLPANVDKKDLEAVISGYILARNRRAYLVGEKAIEAHKVLGTEEKAGVLNVYLQTGFGWFGFENGAFTHVSGGGEPARMRLKKADNGEYEVLEYRPAMDGGMWTKSIREMFPKSLAEKVIKGGESIGKELWEIQAAKAKEYLRQINRGDAAVMSYVPKDRSDENGANAIYRVTLMRKGFPEWNGTKEMLVRAGGPAPGMKIRCTLETRCTAEGNNQYTVILTKTWDIKIGSTQPVSSWKYRVTGDNVTLIESKDEDDRIKAIE